jgi:WD40 repeat protein
VVGIWDVQTGQLTKAIPAYGDIAVSPDATRLAVYIPHYSQGSGFIEFWDIPNGKKLARRKTPKKLSRCVFAPDGRSLITVCPDGTVFVWNMEDYDVHAELDAHSGPIVWLKFIAGGTKWLSYSSREKSIRIWDAATNELIYDLPASNVRSKALSIDGKKLFIGESRRLTEWDLTTGKISRTLPTQLPVLHIAYSPDGRLAWASSGSKPAIHIVDLQTLRELSSISLSDRAGRLSSLSFSSDGRLILKQANANPL